MHIVTQGLVLREVNYKETDKILTVLTREGGKRTVKARNCRKKGSMLTAAAQLLVYSEMTLFEYRDYWSLDEAETLEQFWGVRADLDHLALACYCSEVMETVAEEGRADPAILSLLLNTLYALDKRLKPQALIKAIFELKLMALAGYEPLLECCAICGAEQPKAPQLHLMGGLLHCAACRAGGGRSVALDAGSLAAMRHVLYGDPKRLFSVALDAPGFSRLSAACEAFLMTQLDRGFRTLDYYHALQK